jgi:hypothetical protein
MRLSPFMLDHGAYVRRIGLLMLISDDFTKVCDVAGPDARGAVFAETSYKDRYCKRPGWERRQKQPMNAVVDFDRMELAPLFCVFSKKQQQPRDIKGRRPAGNCRDHPGTLTHFPKPRTLACIASLTGAVANMYNKICDNTMVLRREVAFQLMCLHKGLRPGQLRAKLDGGFFNAKDLLIFDNSWQPFRLTSIHKAKQGALFDGRRDYQDGSEARCERLLEGVDNGKHVFEVAWADYDQKMAEAKRKGQAPNPYQRVFVVQVNRRDHNSQKAGGRVTELSVLKVARDGQSLVMIHKGGPMLYQREGFKGAVIRGVVNTPVDYALDYFHTQYTPASRPNITKEAQKEQFIQAEVQRAGNKDVDTRASSKGHSYSSFQVLSLRYHEAKTVAAREVVHASTNLLLALSQ